MFITMHDVLQMDYLIHGLKQSVHPVILTQILGAWDILVQTFQRCAIDL